MKYVTKNNLENNLKIFLSQIIKPYVNKELDKINSVSFTLNTKIPVFECDDRKFVVIDADGNIISSADNLGSAKWWLNMNSGAGNNRACYTASSDNYPFQTNGDYEGVDVDTTKGCTITYENGNLTITSGQAVVDNKPLTLGTFDLGKALCYKTSS
jgi:hypothetical protein